MINKENIDKLNTPENRETAREIFEGIKNKDSLMEIAKDVADNYSASGFPGSKKPNTEASEETTEEPAQEQ